MINCLICNSPIEPFIDFGSMPLGNGFLLPEQFNEEYRFPMQVSFCPACGMVQLLDQPDREQMFHENYAFFSGTSRYMAQHFKEFADHVIADYLTDDDPFVVEMGSNDGIMLQNFVTAGIRHLGIEPSKNVAQVAIDKGITTVTEFFDAPLARRIITEYGQADAFLAANVMCHIPYIHSIVEGISILLKPGGVVMFEDPYLGDVIEKISYDQIYDEHTFLFSVASIGHLFERYGMEIIDVEPQGTHGGSMRYVIAHKGTRAVSANVAAQRDIEYRLGLHLTETYDKFRRNCENSRDQLMKLLCELRAQGKRVVGYGATSKSTTITNYCGITPDLVEFISDTTPIKQGKFSPGAHIPVRPYESFVQDYPDYALLFAWNHKREIMKKEEAFRAAGGKWIVYVPQVEILD
ncbi:class I SAM-dependent methyltransferase [Geobacter sp. AOG2]|uniref:class I SAM-dependent methyltransferase n=1 Tax=Geobacter sp. AOG2 TaxID=1566347 RepID=UPI001CC62F29|nr:class I SAM-dependent methyltransferase [Geobacter sp. AOG2]GFE62141.1 SAM-dependent methyltransferase [Geobacter sp. AOG2]